MSPQGRNGGLLCQCGRERRAQRDDAGCGLFHGDSTCPQGQQGRRDLSCRRPCPGVGRHCIFEPLPEIGIVAAPCDGVQGFSDRILKVRGGQDRLGQSILAGFPVALP